MKIKSIASRNENQRYKSNYKIIKLLIVNNNWFTSIRETIEKECITFAIYLDAQ